MKQAVAYLRRSTNLQEKSLADQRREIERYAREHDYQILDRTFRGSEVHISVKCDSSQSGR